MVEVVAQLARLNGRQMPRVHADAGSKGSLGDTIGLEFGEQRFQRHTLQVGLKIGQASDCLTCGWLDFPEGARVSQEGVGQRFAMVAKAAFADIAATAGRHAIRCGLDGHDVGAVVAMHFAGDLRSDARPFEELADVALGLLTW